MRLLIAEVIVEAILAAVVFPLYLVLKFVRKHRSKGGSDDR